MRSVVVYESHHGNTRLIAEAIAEGLGGAPALTVGEAGDRARGAGLVVVGGPTRVHTRAARNGGRGGGATRLQARSDDELGLWEWLRDLPRGDGAYAAAFDTRLDKPRWFTGDAAQSIARRLAGHGYEVLGAQSFLVELAEGPLRDGERDRARAFGERLSLMASPAVEIGSSGRRAPRARSARRRGLRSAPGG